MNFEAAFNFVDTAISAQKGKHLSGLQTAILQGAWSGKKYQAIAEDVYCTEGHVKDVAADFWKELSQVLGETVGKRNFKTTLERRIYLKEQPQKTFLNKHHDWGEAPDVSVFFGRTEILTFLEQWFVRDNCRLVTLLGMGGIGKTTLAAKLAQKLEDRYELIIWRSLRNAPPIEETLAELIQFLSNQKEVPLSTTNLDSCISHLLKYLRTSRCLVVLDNAESILATGVRTGCYRAGYEGYGQLLRSVGATSHNSCFVLTSREKPKGLSTLEGENLPVRSFQLTGLSSPIGQEIFSVKGAFTASQDQWQVLIKHYAGNPLALKIVASAIRDCFDSNITNFLEFLQQGSFLFDDIRNLLNQQFQRLSAREQEIMYWLAINQEPISFQELSGDIVAKISSSEMFQILASLQRRSLIEKTAAGFGLQPVVMEYITDEFIEQICQEITSGKINLFHNHALVKVQMKDYVQETQVRLILQPVIERVIAMLGSPSNLEDCLSKFLEQLRSKSTSEIGYAGGNILNLLRQLGVDLNGYDLSRLTLWQANLQKINLQSVNFADSDLAKSVFSETLESVLSVSFSPDGQLLATGDVNGQIRLWQMPTGTLIWTVKAHNNWIPSVAFSPDSQTLVSGSYDQTVKLWDLSSGECIKTYRGHIHGVVSVVFSPDGQIIASGSYDRTIKFWSVKDGNCVQTLSGHGDWVNSVVFSADGQILASGSADCTIKLWSVNSGSCLGTYNGHSQSVSDVAFSPTLTKGGGILASCSADSTVKFWSLSDGSCLKTCTGHTSRVNSIAFSRDGNTLASSSADRTVKLWEIDSGMCLRTFIGHNNVVWSVAFNPQNQILASGSFDQTVRLWNSRTGQSLKTFAGYTNWVRSIAFSPDGQTLVSGHTDNQLRIWNYAEGNCVKTLSGHKAQICTVALSDDGNIIASAGYDRIIRLWDLRTGKILNSLNGHLGWVCSVAFDSGGKILASASVDKTVKLWDVSSGECLGTYTGHDNIVSSVAFSPDGQTLATGSADRTVKLWDVSSGNCLRTYTGHDNVVWSVIFSPNGQTLASGSGDRTVKLWDVSSGNCLRTYTGHQNWVFDLAFSPDGQTLVSASHDYTVKLWDVSSNNCLKTYTGHTKEVYSVAFSSDGKTLASGSQDGTIKLWNLKTG